MVVDLLRKGLGAFRSKLFFPLGSDCLEGAL